MKVCIAGSSGKMGKAIADTVQASGGIEIAALLERTGCADIGKTVNGIKVSDDVKASSAGCNCLIDFTAPEATLDHLSEFEGSAVIGTTGFTAAAAAEIKKYAEKFPVVFAPNMSKGVNLFFSLVRRAAEKLPDYDIEVVEAHHNKKKDSPSGTALKLVEEIKGVRELGEVYGRHGMTGPRKKNEIGIHSVRAGDIVGEHSVVFAGPGECFEISHRAYSRNCFAEGAVAAALWLEGKKPGLYGMSEVLGLR
ncbi:MAG: 4-hydroxy-tetrahydrodipicolinate reductase [Elusimicrobiota bacterium]|nr:4-hydroxy-tetrahydrodipicolinate reductase [Elusimicrobiota bacterium]